MRSIVALFVVSLLISHMAAQTPPGQDTVKGLAEANKIKNDGDRLHFGKQLVGEWEKVDAKVRKDAFKQMAAALKTKDPIVRAQIAELLGSLGGGDKARDSDTATKILVDEFKSAEEDLTYFHAVMMAVGKLGTAKGAEALMKMLRFKDYDAVASAIASLGQFGEAPNELKSSIVEELIKTFTSVAGPAKDTRNSEAQRRLAKVEPPVEQALKQLTKAQEVKGVQGWTTWWNNTGKKSKDW
jgi:hypothetical protein